MESDDERVATVACNSILDRGIGKPAVQGEQSLDDMAAAMTPQERASLMRDIELRALQRLRAEGDGVIDMTPDDEEPGE